jgi:hypothetical protein
MELNFTLEQRMRNILILCALMLALTGCLSAFHRTDTDGYSWASAGYTGNGRTTSASQPDETSPIPVIQQEPSIGQVFLLRLDGKIYEAMKKSDGRVYILKEVR